MTHNLFSTLTIMIFLITNIVVIVPTFKFWAPLIAQLFFLFIYTEKSSDQGKAKKIRARE